MTTLTKAAITLIVYHLLYFLQGICYFLKSSCRFNCGVYASNMSSLHQRLSAP